MKRYPVALLLALIVALPVRAQDASDPADGIAWQPFEEAVASAKDSSKYVLIDIYAPWCGWCEKMQRTVYTDSSVQSYLDEHFVSTRLDATAKEMSYDFQGQSFPVPQLAGALGMRGTPTTVFLKRDGSYLARRPGFVETEDFMSILRYIGSDAHAEQTFKEFVESN